MSWHTACWATPKPTWYGAREPVCVVRRAPAAPRHSAPGDNVLRLRLLRLRKTRHQRLGLPLRAQGVDLLPGAREGQTERGRRCCQQTEWPRVRVCMRQTSTTQLLAPPPLAASSVVGRSAAAGGTGWRPTTRSPQQYGSLAAPEDRACQGHAAGDAAGAAPSCQSNALLEAMTSFTTCSGSSRRGDAMPPGGDSLSVRAAWAPPFVRKKRAARPTTGRRKVPDSASVIA